MAEQSEFSTSSEKSPPRPVSTNNERAWMMWCHLSAFIVFFIPLYGNILGPLIIWLLKKDEYPSVDSHGKESLNFQISLSIYLTIAAFLFILVIGIPIFVGLSLFGIVAVVIASIKAKDGESYQYPFTIRLID